MSQSGVIALDIDSSPSEVGSRINLIRKTKQFEGNNSEGVWNGKQKVWLMSYFWEYRNYR